MGVGLLVGVGAGVGVFSGTSIRGRWIASVATAVGLRVGDGLAVAGGACAMGEATVVAEGAALPVAEGVERVRGACCARTPAAPGPPRR